jgi:hypothetical protein
MRLIFEHMGTDRLVMCLDPANFDLLRDFTADRCTTKLLEIDCTMTDAWLEGHARRVGLAGEATPPDTVAALLPALRNDLHAEVDRIRAARFPGYHRIAETASDADNAAALASFFSIPEDRARELARTPISSPTEDAHALRLRRPEHLREDPPGRDPEPDGARDHPHARLPRHPPAGAGPCAGDPEGSYVTFDDFAANASDAEIADFHRVAAKVCAMLGVSPGRRRRRLPHDLERGRDAVQEVPHYHLHILGGRPLGRMLQPA